MRWPADEPFWIGANLPWLRYGGDFGANAWREDGGVGRPDQRRALRDALARLAGGGATHVRWFMLCDGRAGLRPAADGAPAGLDDFVFRDADAAVDELSRAGLSAIFVLFDFHWFEPAAVVNGVQTCGRGRLATDPGLRGRLLDRVVAPLLERLGRHPSIAAWDVINEPEWVTRTGFSSWVERPTWVPRTGPETASRRTGRLPGPAGVPRAAMRAFIGDIVEAVHRLTAHPATVGSASTRTLRLVEGLGLDVYQAHWYDQFERGAPLDRPVADLGLDRPLILGEFPTRRSRRSPPELLNAARRSGYAGALAWSALAGDEASDADALQSALETFVADRDRRRG